MNFLLLPETIQARIFNYLPEIDLASSRQLNRSINQFLDSSDYLRQRLTFREEVSHLRGDPRPWITRFDFLRQLTFDRTGKSSTRQSSASGHRRHLLSTIDQALEENESGVVNSLLRFASSRKTAEEVADHLVRRGDPVKVSEDLPTQVQEALLKARWRETVRTSDLTTIQRRFKELVRGDQSESFLQVGLLGAGEGGRLEVVEWFHQRMTSPDYSVAILGAARENQTELLTELVSRQVGTLELILLGAIRGGHLTLLQETYDRLGDWSPEYSKWILSYPSWPILEWSIEGSHLRLEEAVRKMAQGDDLHHLRLLYQFLSDKPLRNDWNLPSFTWPIVLAESLPSTFEQLLPLLDRQTYRERRETELDLLFVAASQSQPEALGLILPYLSEASQAHRRGPRPLGAQSEPLQNSSQAHRQRLRLNSLDRRFRYDRPRWLDRNGLINSSTWRNTWGGPRREAMEELDKIAREHREPHLSYLKNWPLLILAMGFETGDRDLLEWALKQDLTIQEIVKPFLWSGQEGLFVHLYQENRPESYKDFVTACEKASVEGEGPLCLIL